MRFRDLLSANRASGNEVVYALTRSFLRGLAITFSLWLNTRDL
jgi:hypothetical protein